MNSIHYERFQIAIMPENFCSIEHLSERRQILTGIFFFGTVDEVNVKIVRVGQDMLLQNTPASAFPLEFRTTVEPGQLIRVQVHNLSPFERGLNMLLKFEREPLRRSVL